MATLYDLAMQYLNQSLPKTFKYDRTNQPGIGPRLPIQPEEPIAKILPRPGGNEEGFSVYNPDPNSIVNKTYQPNYAYRQFVDYNPELSDLQNQKIMQGTANFKGYDYYNLEDF